jgi:hypothetical protein
MAIAFDASLGGTAFTTGTSTTAAHTTTAAAAAGSRIIVCVGDFNATVTVSSVSGGGLTWVKDEEDATGHNARGAVFSADAPSGLASGTTITATYSATADSRWICAQSFTGIATGASGYLTGTPPTATNAFGGTTFTLPSITPADANALIFGLISLDGVTADVVSWTSTGANEIQTIFNATTTEGGSTGYRIVSSIAAYALAGTFSVAPGEQGYNSVAYKAAASTASAPPPAARPLLPLLQRFSPFRFPWFPAPQIPAVTATLSFLGALATLKMFNKALTATLSFTGAFVKSTSHGMTAALGFTGAFVKAVAKSAFSATLSFTGALTKRTRRALTATLSFTGAIATLKAFGKALTATLSFTGAFAKLPTKALTATLSFTGATAARDSPRADGDSVLHGLAGEADSPRLTATLSFTGAFAPSKSFLRRSAGHPSRSRARWRRRSSSTRR